METVIIAEIKWSNFAKKIENCFEKTGVVCQLYDGVESEFTPGTIANLVEKHKAFNPDIIIGLGGGSALDAAKAFVFSTNILN